MDLQNINTNVAPVFTEATKVVRNNFTLRNVVIGVVLLLVLYYIFNYFFGAKDTTHVVSLHPANKSLTVPVASMPGSNSTNYTISLWMNINDFNYSFGEKKNIAFRSISSATSDSSAEVKGCPDIYLDPTTNAITANIPYGSPSNPTMFSCTVPDIPLQDWFCYILTINQNTIDIYINGKLVKTCVLPSTTVVDPNSPLIVNYQYPGNKNVGFSGNISDFKYSSKSINPDQAFDIYQKGYSGSSVFGSFFDKYKVKLAFVEDNKEIRSIQI